MDRIFMIDPRGYSDLAFWAKYMYINIIVKHIYWYISQISGEHLQDHWSSGKILNLVWVKKWCRPDCSVCNLIRIIAIYSYMYIYFI